MIAESSALSFWIALGAIFYVYLGYPFLLFLISLVRKQIVLDDLITPPVSILIAAYNEEERISRCIDSCLKLDYPKDKLEILVGSDGSTDRTQEVVEGYREQGVKLLVFSRRGKALADNELIKACQNDIVVTTSAGSLFEPNFLKALVRSFADPTVGVVTGKVCFSPFGRRETPTSMSEGVYWRYEMLLRGLESRVGILAVSAGAGLGFRKEIYEPLKPSSDADNMIPIHARVKGFRVVYEPSAVVHDEVIASADQELKDRIRQVTKSLRDTLDGLQRLHPVEHWDIFFSLLSHKILRWLTPFFLLIALISNVFLVQIRFYQITLLMQFAFYAAAGIGIIAERLFGVSFRFLAIPANFCIVNSAFLAGVLNVLRGQQMPAWHRARTKGSEGSGPIQELERIQRAYSRRDASGRSRLYSRFDPAGLFITQSREQELLELLQEQHMTPLWEKRILEVGCGTGGMLRDFIQYGANPKNLLGVDLLADRIRTARELSPNIDFQCFNAEILPYEDMAFDLVMQFTVFTSILDSEMKRNIAREMLRVLKPDGIILWYDFHVNNPWNPDVKVVKKGEIRELFPGCRLTLKRVTLAAPIVRAIAPYSWLACFLLEKIPFLCTHYLGVIRKR